MECWEQEENNWQERAEAACQELAEHQDREEQAHLRAGVCGETQGMGRQSGWECEGTVTRSSVECTYELVKASKHGKKSCDQCSSMKEQCVPVGVKKSQKHVVLEEAVQTSMKCVLEEKMSPRASKKKKHMRAKSLEVEIVEEGSQAKRGKGVPHDMLISQGPYAIPFVKFSPALKVLRANMTQKGTTKLTDVGD
ncbi:hypothetical protein EDD16DRAFT_1523485 [Pisolithus croceorrhizus]|nr:hypothetical protein EDD16DRAFT_1523485 [Pisolithus croceorrhizus]